MKLTHIAARKKRGIARHLNYLGHLTAIGICKLQLAALTVCISLLQLCQPVLAGLLHESKVPVLEQQNNAKQAARYQAIPRKA